MRLALLSGLDLLEDLLVFRKAVRLLIRIHDLLADENFEDAARALAQRRGDAVPVFDGGLQTGGLREVVSLPAVEDLDVHAGPSFPELLRFIV